MPNLKIESIKLGMIVKSELPSLASRKKMQVAATTALRLGQVVRLDTSLNVVGALGTANDIQSIVVTGTATSGTYSLRLWHYLGYWVQTAPIAYDANTTAIAAAINLVLGTSAVGVTGSPIATITLTFSGTNYTLIHQPLVTMDWSVCVGVTAVANTRTETDTNDVQTIAVTGTLSGGTIRFRLKKANGTWGDTFAAWNTTWATMLGYIQAALDLLCGANGCVASGAAATALVLTFSGTGYAGLRQEDVEVDVQQLTGATFATLTHTTYGGDPGLDAIGICAEEVTSAAGVQQANMLVRDCVVDAGQLTYGSRSRSSVITTLEKLGILCREEATMITEGT